MNTRRYRVIRVPLSVAPMWHVTGTLTRDGFSWSVPDGLLVPETWAGSEVRVTYRFAASERGVLNEAVIRDLFKGAARLHLDPIAVPDRGLRAPEVAAARTLTEKLQAWTEHHYDGATGDGATTDLFDKLAQLEHGDGPRVLTALAQQLDTWERDATPAREQAAA